MRGPRTIRITAPLRQCREWRKTPGCRSAGQLRLVAPAPRHFHPQTKAIQAIQAIQAIRRCRGGIRRCRGAIRRGQRAITRCRGAIQAIQACTQMQHLKTSMCRKAEGGFAQEIAIRYVIRYAVIGADHSGGIYACKEGRRRRRGRRRGRRRRKPLAGRSVIEASVHHTCTHAHYTSCLPHP